MRGELGFSVNTNVVLSNVLQLNAKKYSYF